MTGVSTGVGGEMIPFLKIRCTEKLLRWPEGWKLSFYRRKLNEHSLFSKVKPRRGYAFLLETENREKDD